MRKNLAFTLLLLCGCTDTGTKNQGALDLGGSGGAFAVVTSSEAIAPGADCAAGGTRVNVGLDNGDGGGTAHDGSLQTGEIDQTKVLCNTTAPASETVTRSTVLSLGDMDCPFGGARVDHGLDNGDGGGIAGNGVLEDGELDATTYACLSQPGALLVASVNVPLGSTLCPYGGQTLTSGLDDGSPGGTANNAVLDVDEIDVTSTTCNPTPDSVFPEPTGSAGTAFLDASGGAANGSGSGSAVGRNGGEVTIAAYGGPLDTLVEVSTKGTVAPATNVAAPTVDAGAHPIVISANTTIGEAIDDGSSPHPSGLHVWTPQNASKGTLYDGDVVVTSLEIADTFRLTFDGATDPIGVQVLGDVHNRGRITTPQPSGARRGLYLECRNFVNEASGIIDLRGNASTGSLEIRAGLLPHTSGAIHNLGVLRTDGWDATDVNGPAIDTSAANLSLVAAGNIFNGDRLIASGGTTDSDSDLPPPLITVRTLRGVIANTGRINASGGVSDGRRNGGTILIFNGYDELLRDLGSSQEALDVDPAATGPGGFDSTGVLSANGGLGGTSASNGGDGGLIVVSMQGGAIRMSPVLAPTEPLLSVRGGNTRSTNFGAGNGGRIKVATMTYVNSSTVTVPSELALAGSIDAKGGTGVGTSAYSFGGEGGRIKINLDVPRTGSGQRRGPGSELLDNPTARVDLEAVRATGQQPAVRLLGLGGGIAVGGGDTSNLAGARTGLGGQVQLVNRVCESGLLENGGVTCVVPAIGTRMLRNTVAITARGGTSNNPNGGGQVWLELDQSTNQLTATTLGARLDNRGAIDVAGGDSTSADGSDETGAGGTITIHGDAGDCLNSGALSANGGDGPTDATGFQVGGGGTVQLQGFSVINSAPVATYGGVAGRASGSRGTIYISGYDVLSSGLLTNTGVSGLGEMNDADATQDDEGDVVLQAGRALTNSAAISADGVGFYADALESAAGGAIKLRGATIVNSGNLTASSYTITDGAGYVGQGGYIAIVGGIVTNSGVLTADGGDCSAAPNASAGPGGFIFYRSNGGTQSAALSAQGGSASDFEGGTTGSYAGSGGTIHYWGTATIALDVSGGDASADASTDAIDANGGNGGEVVIHGNNAATINAQGGNVTTGMFDESAGGVGGHVTVDGTNSACIDVTSGTPLPGDVAGTITPADLPNACS